uniref:Uncharacterized protein n=1 Tax=Rhizophora mucronata TaxID=61149 RepID=A0A2P2NIP7_RHIMU
MQSNVALSLSPPLPMVCTLTYVCSLQTMFQVVSFPHFLSAYQWFMSKHFMLTLIAIGLENLYGLY